MPIGVYVRRKSSELGTCSNCGVSLTDENWTDSNQKYKRYMCKACFTARQRAYDDKTISIVGKESFLAHKRQSMKKLEASWDAQRKESKRRIRYGGQLKRKLGIEIEVYDNLFELQKGKCAICGNTEPKGRGTFHVDHCHKTKTVRGLLCASYNMVLGMMQDSIPILQMAIDYLALFCDEDHKHEARLIAGGKQF